MSSTAFAERCTATQLVQAVSFPLAVALRGQRQGWVSAESAEKWALQILSILFHGRGYGAGGLLRKVEQRYEQNEQKSTFKEVVGDGTLWVVLVSTLGKANWQGVGTDIDKAVALREVFTSPQLLASAESNQVANLLGRIRIEDAKSYLAEVAPKVSGYLNQIENILNPTWEAAITTQKEQFIIHKVGDLFWRKQIGWAICLAETKNSQLIKVRLRGVETEVGVGYYVNVTDLASRNPELSSLIGALRACVTNPV